MKTVIPAELQKLLKKQPKLTLLDVRTPVEYAEVHVREARNVPLDGLDPRGLFASGQIQRGIKVYLICRTDSRSRDAAGIFLRYGFDQTVVIEGGTSAWIKAGLPVERGVVKVISLERQVRIAAGVLVVLGVVLGWLIHPFFYGVSAFVGAGLVFAGVSDWCGMGLLIAKLPWNRKASPEPTGGNAKVHLKPIA
jgi:rhodanese-related sulfurtransferase